MRNDSELEKLEGSFDVKLAPVLGEDNRKNINKNLFIKKPKIFLIKFFSAFSIILISYFFILNYTNSYYIIIPIIICGLMYAHLIELQHECLHNHAFNSKLLNRIFGIICGVFLFSSYSHYRYDHLRHHAYLGTEKNIEHFDYRFQNLDSISGFLISFFDLSRYKRVFYIIYKTFTNKKLEEIQNKKYEKEIKQEYIIYLLFFMFSIIYTVIENNLFFVYSWWIPALLISEGVHFMIELPEHFGLNTQTNPDVLSNTRTIKTNFIISWFVNGNDLHTAHHYHQGVPMCNIKELHRLIDASIENKCLENNYLSFFKKVIKGEIKQLSNTTAMKR